MNYAEWCTTAIIDLCLTMIVIGLVAIAAGMIWLLTMIIADIVRGRF